MAEGSKAVFENYYDRREKFVRLSVDRLKRENPNPTYSDYNFIDCINWT
jgi:hypothetical protein